MGCRPSPRRRRRFITFSNTTPPSAATTSRTVGRSPPSAIATSRTLDWSPPSATAISRIFDWSLDLADPSEDFGDLSELLGTDGDPSSGIPTETQTENVVLENLLVDTSDNNEVPQSNYDEANTDGNGLQSELPAIEKRHVQNQFTVVPGKGMEFSLEKEAYEFYKNYAQQIGFSVRKGKVVRLANGTIRKRHLLCSREGFKSGESLSNNRTRYQRRETRTGCKANIQLTFEDGKWVISDLILDHNHDLDRQTIQRSVSTSVREENLCTINYSEEPGPSTEHPIDHINASIRNEGGITNNMMDSTNYLHRNTKNSPLQPQYIQSLIDCFKHLQVKDPLFLYTIQVDAESRCTNFFWRDGGSMIDYEYFGDVLVLNTAALIKVETYDMICASFWGVNHHQQCILFGFALLLDGTEDSFLWLLKSFMETMGNRQPKIIYTDESEAIASALKVVLPQTKHRIGMCYISKNAEKYLSTCYQHYPNFPSTFNKCIFECPSKQEFESQWNLLLVNYELRENLWLGRLFELREKWSHLFFNDKKTFTAGVESSLNSMNINTVFQNSDNTTDIMTLPSLVQLCVQEAENRRRLEETNEDFCTCNETVPSRSRNGLEKHAEDIYTCTMFKMFEGEYIKSIKLEMEEINSLEGISTFKLMENNCKEYEVVSLRFVGSVPSIACGCAKFESCGILCSHSLKVLCSRNVSHIPAKYVLKRWTKSAKDGAVMDDQREEMAGNSNEQLSLCSRKLIHRAVHLITKSAQAVEIRKIVKDCLDMAHKEVANVLKTKGVEHTNNVEVDCEDDCDDTIDGGSVRKRKKKGSNS